MAIIGKALRAAAVALAITLLAFPTAAGTPGEQVIGVSGLAFPHEPAANDRWLARTQLEGRRGRLNLYAFPLFFEGESFRINPGGTAAHAGSIEGNVLTYSEVRRRRGDIRFFDLQDRAHLPDPAAANTKQHESVVSRSGNWLLFRRSPKVQRGPQQILLHNLATGEERVLDTGTSGRRYVQPGTVRGDYAAWFRCRGDDPCFVFRYRISTGEVVRLPNPRTRAQYAVSVTGNGTVYFVEGSDIECGRRVGLWRFTPDGRRILIGRVRKGRDVAVTSPAVAEDGSVTLFFDIYNCRLDTLPWGVRAVHL